MARLTTSRFPTPGARTFALFALLLGCDAETPGSPAGADTGPPIADTTTPDARTRNGAAPDATAPDAVEPADIEALVTAFLEASPSEEATALAALEAHDPGAVREAILAVDHALPRAAANTGITHGHPIDTGLQSEVLAGREFTYSLYVPPGYTPDPNHPYPLLVDPAHPTNDPDGSQMLPTLAAKTDDRFLIITVHAFDLLHHDPPPGWDDASNTQRAWDELFDVFDAAIADVRRRYVVDSDRVYITGISASGAASWFNALFSTDTYAAFAPVSVFPAPWDEPIYRGLHDIGIGIVHGDQDTITPVSGVTPTVEMLQSWGYDVQWWLFEGEGHGTMFTAHLPDLADWMLEHHRDVSPDRVHRGIKTLRRGGAYWLWATALAEPPPQDQAGYGAPVAAELSAERTGNVVTVQGRGVCRFEVWFEPDTFDPDDTVEITYNSIPVAAASPIAEHLLPLQIYKRTADIGRLFSGRFRVDVGGDVDPQCP